VLVGNLIVDFDYEMMARVLKVPDEKFRDKVYKSIRENLSTIKRELGSAPPREELWPRWPTSSRRCWGRWRWRQRSTTPGGLVRAVFEVRDCTLTTVSFSGDLFFYPEEKLADLERALTGVAVEDTLQVVTRFYDKHGIESPGVAPEDLTGIWRFPWSDLGFTGTK
jgi:lipoate-protein ligase A